MTEPFDEELNEAIGAGHLRAMRVVESPQERLIRINGRDVVNFSSNDYLGLSTHPLIKKAVRDCVEKYGWGGGASRLISGNMEPHAQFESKVAEFLGKPSALLFTSGYAANMGVLTALLGKGDTVYLDRLCHASIVDGARYSGARLERFIHNDPESLEKHLSKNTSKTGKKLVVTEGIFSMDGDRAPLKAIAAIAEKYGAMFMVDDAHGVGVTGPGGRGTIHEEGVQDMVDIHVITLGKALGGAGGVIAGSRRLTDGLINFARPFIYSTAVPPATASAGLAAIEIVSGVEGDERRLRLKRNIGTVISNFEKIGYTLKVSESQIVPVILGHEVKVTDMAAWMLEKGVFVPFIRRPTVPKGTERFRVSVTSEHTDSDLAVLSEALKELTRER